MRIKIRNDKFYKDYICKVCGKIFISNTTESYCNNCFKIVSDTQLKIIKEKGLSFEKLINEKIIAAAKILDPFNIQQIEMTENEMDELYNSCKDKLRYPVRKEDLTSIRGIPIKIVK